MDTLHEMRFDRQTDAIRLIPEFNRGPHALLVLAHGVGSSMDDLAPLAKALAAAVPGLAVVSLNAPQAFDGAASGRQWFSVKGVTEANRSERVAAVLPQFRARILAEAGAIGLGAERVIVGGFSQGAIMSLALGAEAEENWLGLMSLSGRLASQPKAPNIGQSVLVIHGEDDGIMPLGVAQRTVDWLRQSSWSISSHILPRLGHQIDKRVLNLVVDYVLTRAETLVPSR